MRSAPVRLRLALCLWGAAILVPFLLGQPALAEPMAPEPPTCDVQLDVLSAVAKPTSTSADTLTFDGNIHVSLGFIGGTRTLHISATAFPSTWGASIDPASREVSGTADVNFTASLGVPAAELSTTSGRLVVSAYFQWVTGVDEPVTECSQQANIQVAQYYAVNVDTETPRIAVKTGPVGQTVAVLVQNLGNGRDTFRIELENKAELEAIGILTSLPLSASLQPNVESNVTFTVNATSAVEEDVYELYIMVTSAGDPTVRRDTQITVEAETDIVSKIFDPTVFIVLAVLIVTAIGVLVAVRSSRRKKRARLAKKQLDRIRRQQREAQVVAEVEEAPPPERQRVRARPEPRNDGTR